MVAEQIPKTPTVVNAPKCAVFIDGPSLCTLETRLNKRFAYELLPQWIADDCGLFMTTARYFTVVHYDQNGYADIERLLRWLECNGFTVARIVGKRYPDSQRTVVRGSVDTHIVAETIELSKNVDEIMLISGDGALSVIGDPVRRNGARFTVLSSEMLTPPLLSDDLRRTCDRFVELTNTPLLQEREKPKRETVNQNSTTGD